LTVCTILGKAQKPLVSEYWPLVIGPPASGWPIVPSSMNCALVLTPFPPAILNQLMEYCARAVQSLRLKPHSAAKAHRLTLRKCAWAKTLDAKTSNTVDANPKSFIFMCSTFVDEGIPRTHAQKPGKRGHSKKDFSKLKSAAQTQRTK